MARFTAELGAAIKGVNDNLDKVWRKSVAEAFNQTVQATPVDTGAAKASWLAADNNTGATGTTELNVLPSQVPQVGGSWLLFSNLPYIERLEDGYSLQAPVGMVKPVVARWPSIVRSNGG